MARKTKRVPLPPMVVGKASDGSDVVLSDRIQRLIQDVPAGKAREAFKQAQIVKAIKSAEGRITYLQRRDQLSMTPSTKVPGYLFVNGTGSSRSACFSKKQGLAFLAQIAEFERLINALPDVETDETPESEE